MPGDVARGKELGAVVEGEDTGQASSVHIGSDACSYVSREMNEEADVMLLTACP